MTNSNTTDISKQTAFILYRNSEPISVYLDPDTAEMDLITCRREDIYTMHDFCDKYEIRICSFVGE